MQRTKLVLLYPIYSALQVNLAGEQLAVGVDIFLLFYSVGREHTKLFYSFVRVQ